MTQMTIRAARVNCGMTQQNLADKMGVSRRTIHNWESGKKAPSKEHITVFCDVTGTDQDDLFLPLKFPN